jgi:hypothetical protein
VQAHDVHITERDRRLRHQGNLPGRPLLGIQFGPSSTLHRVAPAHDRNHGPFDRACQLAHMCRYALPMVMSGAAKLGLRRWSGAGSNCRPLVFQPQWSSSAASASALVRCTVPSGCSGGE